MTNELLYGLFFILLAAGFITWLIRGTGRENQIHRDWWAEKQRVREIMREIREEEEQARHYQPFKSSHMPIKPLCSGRGCPVANQCHRYQAVIDTRTEICLMWVPYDHVQGRCEFGPKLRTIEDRIKKIVDDHQNKP